MQGSQEHNDMARATASVLGERAEKARAQAGGRRKGEALQFPSL